MTNPVRVLHAGTGNMYGGVEAVISRLARSSDLAPGLDQRFALGFEGLLAKNLRDSGAGVEVFGPAAFGKPWTIRSARHRFARLLARDRPDVVVCHGAWTHALVAAEVRRRARAWSTGSMT